MVKFKLRTRIRTKVDLNDCKQGMAVGARRTCLGMPEVSDLLGFLCTTILGWLIAVQKREKLSCAAIVGIKMPRGCKRSVVNKQISSR